MHAGTFPVLADARLQPIIRAPNCGCSVFGPQPHRLTPSSHARSSGQSEGFRWPSIAACDRMGYRTRRPYVVAITGISFTTHADFNKSVANLQEIFSHRPKTPIIALTSCAERAYVSH